MKNFSIKMFLIACLIFSAAYSHAQFNMNNNTNIGQSYQVDSIKGIATFVVDFNTAKDSSTWKYTDETNTTYTVSFSKCQTQRGMQVNIFEDETATAAKIINGDLECRDYGANRNPVRVSSIAYLNELLTKYTAQKVGTADSVKNVTWKPSACLFDLDATGNNQGFGASPGMYKVVEYGFQYNFSGREVSSDIVFDVQTYDAGNTTKTASYALTVATGSATNIVGTVENIYVTGSAKKTIKLAEAIGKTPELFSNTKVYFFLKTMGTGTAKAKGTYDPTVVFDNFSVSMKLPQWIDPAAGIQANKIVNNSTTPVSGTLNAESTFSIPLKTSGRLGTLSIVNDLQDNTKKIFTFLETGALKAKDASGKYTVDVAYTLTPAVLNTGTMVWSKAKIEVAAPATGSVNDDLMFYFMATPTSTNAKFDRLELNCGTRIWYDFYFSGKEAVAVTKEWNISDASFNALGTLTSKTVVNGLTIHASADKSVAIDANNKSIDGMDFTSRLKLGGSGEFIDGAPTARVLEFEVSGNTKITVAGMSSSSGSDRELKIAAGTMDNIIGTFPALGASIGKQDFEYKGGATKIYVYSPSSGVNIYYMKAAPMVTAIPEMKAADNLIVFPNPAKEYAKIRFTLTDNEFVKLSLVTLTGQVVKTSSSQNLFKGVNELEISTKNLKNGLYIYRLSVGSEVYTGKLNVLN